jgi:hypothetical protein
VTTTEAAPASTAPAAEPPTPRLSPRSRDALAIGILLVAFLVPLRGLLRIPGPPMEEGFMLVFPERVLNGAIPNKDFLHLYGPGSLWVLAGVYKVFGTSLTVERLFGLLQQMAIVFGVFALARRWGRTVAVGCALLSLLFIVPTGLTALAWVGAVGLGLLALVAGAASRDATDPRRAERLALLAGALVGFALLYRIDLVLAVGLSVLALGWGARRALQRRFVIGLGLGLVPYVIHLATAGPDNVIRGMITDPLFKLRGGRSLPIPPSWNRLDGTLERFGNLVSLHWPVPTMQAPAQLTIWFFLLLASVAVLAAVGIWAVRRDGSLRARLLLAVAGFSVGIAPQALQRADGTHLAWVSCVAMAFVPVATLEVLRANRPHWRTRTIGIATTAALFAVVVLLITDPTARTYADYSLQTFGVHRSTHTMSHRGRIFYYGRADDATAATRLTAEVERISKPGQRVFVGPQDLRKTPFSDAFFYYLLPQLTPGTYYIEMDPGVANAKDSGLADEVRRADLLILSSSWNYWSEPNNSRHVGPDAPNQVVRTQFCLVGTFGPHYKLYQHCHR